MVPTSHWPCSRSHLLGACRRRAWRDPVLARTSYRLAAAQVGPLRRSALEWPGVSRATLTRGHSRWLRAGLRPQEVALDPGCAPAADVPFGRLTSLPASGTAGSPTMVPHWSVGSKQGL